MYCIKPLDKDSLLKAAANAKAVITIEEHSVYGGLGSLVSQLVSANCPKKVINLALPDEPAISGKSPEVFDYYGLSKEGIIKTAMELMNDVK
jgi:transketolase